MADLQVLITVPEAVVYGIAAARAGFNAEQPQAVDSGQLDANGAPVMVPNPALINSDADYLVARIGDVVASWAKQHAAAATPAPVPPTVINGVPQAVDMVKAEVYFIRLGVLATIKAAVAAAGAEAQAIWARSKTIQRQNPLMLQIAHQVLGWTDAQIDYHFTEADRVVV
jgi:hypothetical protein